MIRQLQIQQTINALKQLIDKKTAEVVVALVAAAVDAASLVLVESVD